MAGKHSEQTAGARRPWLTRGRLAGVAVVLLACGSLMTVSAFAVFTDTKSVTGNAFTTGTVSLTTDHSDPSNVVLVTFTAMMPGDSTAVEPIAITNAGNQSLRYAITSTADNTDTKALAGQLALTVKTDDAGDNCVSFATDTAIYTGALDVSPPAVTKIVGDPAQGAQTGDRTLASGASETLCFQVALPLTTGNGFQGASTTATFTFDAEQTKNNP